MKTGKPANWHADSLQTYLIPMDKGVPVATSRATSLFGLCPFYPLRWPKSSQVLKSGPSADVTVVIYTPGRPGRQTVTANSALRQGELGEKKCDAVVAALASVLPR